MKKTIAFVMAIVMTILLLASCAPAEKPAEQAAPSAGKPYEGHKLACITGTGGLGDNNLNDFCYAGVKVYEEQGATVDVVQPSDISDTGNLQRMYAETGEYDAVVVVSFDNWSALNEVAKEFPEQRFIIADSMVEADNVTSVQFRPEETGFQAGIIASMIAKESKLPLCRGENTIGFIGGMDTELIHQFAAGFSLGAKLVNPDVNILIAYVGGFGDPSTAAELAVSQYDQGADAIFQCAGGSGLGVIKAAEEHKGYAIGLETNQNVLAPDYVIASCLRDWEGAVGKVVKEALDGTIKAGANSFGIADGGVVPTYDDSKVEIGDAVKTAVSEYSALVVNGSIRIPIALEDVDAYLADCAEYIMK